MSFLRKNWKYTILATFGFCLLIYAFYTYVVINPAVHLAIAKLAKTYLDEQTKEAETLLNEFWEDAANNLRPKSLEERQQYLAEYRTALESDSEVYFE